MDLPLSSRLSQALVAFTIEVDNEFEERMRQRLPQRRPWLGSLVLYVNFLRFVPPDGVALRDVRALARLSNLGGLRRWGYITLDPDPGEASPLGTALVRPTAAGRIAQEVWQPLPGLVEGRWRERCGAAAIDELRAALSTVVATLDVRLPRHLPILGFGNGMRSGRPDGLPAEGDVGLDLSALLAKVLLAITLEFEAAGALSLPICADVLRVLTPGGVRVRDIPALSGVSKEGISAALGFLGRRGHAVVGPDPTSTRTRAARLTPTGEAAKDAYLTELADVGRRWRRRHGAGTIDSLQARLETLVEGHAGEPSPLAGGLRPYPEGWRARRPYLSHTNAMLRDPGAALPHHPMVLHRGGFPDGS